MKNNTFWNQQGQLVSSHYDDIYFSSDNGLNETRHVFLQHNNLEKRFSDLTPNSHFTIAETGFGTGLNFLATCQLWQATATPGAQLHFISVEKFPLSSETISKALAPWKELNTLHKQLIACYPILTKGFHRVAFSENISLTLIINDAEHGLSQLIANTYLNNTLEARQWLGVDAWFMDGFAPSKNPDMWTESLFETIAKLSKENTTLATFTAAGFVRRNLIAHGFSVDKVPGYGQKREMITACYNHNEGINESTNHESTNEGINVLTEPSYLTKKQGQSPWALIHNHTLTNKENTIAIIGGGLAGCHTAYALAKKGYRVKLFEKDHIAAGASGNAQGLVYAKLTANNEPQGAFNLFSLLYAQNFYTPYWKNCQKDQGQQCGILQLATTDKLKETQQNIANYHAELIQQVSAEQASQLAGTTINFSALHFPRSGWIAPAELCQWLIDSDNISVSENTSISNISSINKKWQLTTGNGETCSFHTVIITNAYDASQLLPVNDLPIRKIRGQVSHYQPAKHATLNTAVCGEGYIAPSETFHCLGASFNLGDNHLDLSLKDHQENLSKIALQVPDIIDDDALQPAQLNKLPGRVSFRCTTPDYLPIVGGIPDTTRLQTHFASLSHNAHKIPNISGHYLPNLYINIGHGSRGLTYTPLCAEILASLIEGSAPPAKQSLIQRLSPARFTIRDLVRKQ